MHTSYLLKSCLDFGFKDTAMPECPVKPRPFQVLFNVTYLNMSPEGDFSAGEFSHSAEWGVFGGILFFEVAPFWWFQCTLHYTICLSVIRIGRPH
jgi:hypothetical protein